MSQCKRDKKKKKISFLVSVLRIRLSFTKQNLEVSYVFVIVKICRILQPMIQQKDYSRRKLPDQATN